MQKWIAATDAQWQAAYQRDVTDVHEAEAKRLMLQYLNLLEEAIAKASKASDLDGALALRAEQKRFGDTQLFPEQDEAGDPAAVKQARAAIRGLLAQLEKGRANRAKALHAKYDQVLAQAQAQLTQRQRLDDALLVKKQRDEVAAAWIAPAISAATASQPAVQPVVPPKVAATKPPAPATPQAAGGTSLRPGRNVLANGNFDAADADGNPEGWTVPARAGYSFKVVREGSNSFLHATGTGEIRPTYVVQEIPIPARAKTVTLKGRIRGKWETRDTKDGNWGATIDATFIGEDEKKFGPWIILVGGRLDGWQSLSKTRDVEAGAKRLHVHFGFQFATGTFDFDDIVVEFH
jgi:hypothetical protein